MAHPLAQVPRGCAGRFFFDNRQRKPTAADFDALLLKVFEETLEQWREQIEEPEANQPPRELTTCPPMRSPTLGAVDPEPNAVVPVAVAREPAAPASSGRQFRMRTGM